MTYYQEREIFHQKHDLEDSAKIYNIELAGLVAGLLESISFINHLL